jgi:phosphatidate cytidylyltransferase
MLLARVLTAIVLIPLVLLAVLKLNPLHFEILAGIVFLGCAYEWAKLAPFDRVERWAFIISIVLLDAILMMVPTTPILMLAVIGWLYAIYCCHQYSRSPMTFRFEKWQWLAFGWLALGPSWLALCSMRFFIGQESDVIFLLLLIWGADSGAYFAGKYFGKNLLAPNLSPKKTWEGVKGAALATLIVVMVHGIYLHLPWYRWLAYVLVYFVTLIFAIYGDLFESLIKRLSGAKDSGGLLPGHGGLLDRLDSLFAAAPVFGVGLVILTLCR